MTTHALTKPGSASRSRSTLGVLASFALFSLWAGQFWRNALGWWGWAALALAAVVVALWALWRYRPAVSWRHQPKAVYAFLGLAAVSIAWSAYPGASALGATATLATTLIALTLGLTLSWAELLRALAGALRAILVLSLLFEAWVAFVLRGPLLPNFLEVDPDGTIPKAFYWSRGLLLDGGPIEGIVGNRNLLGMIALLALIVFAVQLAARSVSRGTGWAWLGLAALTLVLTRSATVTLTVPVVAIVLGLALWTRSRGERSRRPVYLTALFGGLGLAAAAWAASPLLLRALGRSSDLTNRFDIWAAVSALAETRPMLGWGWVSYWIPWVEPFNDLVVIKGVTYLQAHNAWLDLWLQLGALGVLVFAGIVLSVLWRSWFLAVDRPQLELRPMRYRASALLPLLLVTALLVQSLAESRLLYEANWALLVTLAVLTKRRGFGVEEMP